MNARTISNPRAHTRPSSLWALLLTLAVVLIAPETLLAQKNGAGESRTLVGNPQLTGGALQAPLPGGPVEIVSLQGPGVLVSAWVSKQGGDSDFTTIRLLVDGQLVAGGSPQSLRALGLTETNPTGVALLDGASFDTITIGFPVPIAFEESLILTAEVPPSDTNIVQILGRVIHGK